MANGTLKEWLDNELESINNMAKHIKDNKKLGVTINRDKADEMRFEFETEREVDAFRMGLLCAIGSLAGYPE